MSPTVREIRPNTWLLTSLLLGVSLSGIAAFQEPGESQSAPAVETDLYVTLTGAFAEAGIEVPFLQRDLETRDAT